MKKRTLCRLFLAAATILGTQVASAQIYNASTQDNVAGTYNGPPETTHTGNAVVRFGSGEMKAFVWDGGNPTLAWEHTNGTGKVSIAGAGLNIGTLTDPDVVLNPAGGIEVALITYLLGDQVYYEVQEYDPGANTFNLVVSPTKVNAGTTPCHSPNVDVNENGIAVIVYGQEEPNTSNPLYPFNRIYTRTTDLNGGGASLTPVFEFIRVTSTNVLQYKALKPDVAVYKDWASVVYINDVSGSNKNVNIKQYDINQIALGGINTSGNIDHSYVVTSSFADVGSPRIAGPVYGMGLDDKDFQAVVQVNKTIVGLNRYAAASSTMSVTSLNVTSGLNQCDVLEPVVAYLFDKIIVAWNQKFCAAVGGTETKEIVARQLIFNGNPNGTSYSVVNFDRKLACYFPSLDGRYHNTDALYTFIGGFPKEVLYKSSFYTNNNLRLAPGVNSNADLSKASISIYPNPLLNEATVHINLTVDEIATSLEVFNLTGQRIANLNVADLKAGANQLAWNTEPLNIPSGLYMLKLKTNKSTVALKVQKN